MDSHANAGVPPAVAYAIQERAICENPNAGPDGIGVRADDCAYTMEARSVPQAVAYSVALRGRDGGGTAELGGDLATCLRASGGGGDKPHVLAPIGFYPTNRQPESGVYEDVAPTLSVGASGSSGNPPGVCTQSSTNAAAMAVRRLMPVECEKLQGFTPGHTAVTVRGKPAADGPRYKQVGNSMAVAVMRWLGVRIDAALSPQSLDDFDRLLGDVDPFEELLG